MADVRVDVKVDDKGSLKKVGKSAQSARRQIGGVAKTASSSGKQFSKMSQGMTGGLVPAYAQLAATLFAVDAVFRALKQSADLRVQKEGMIAYASATGVAMQTVARDLQAATDAQLSFKDAASASAIGLAAGLSADQMNEIGKAAKNASIALGRNFSDSFDRVLKGIVKGEPELLDELGIILRLENATRKYADAMGVAREDLTAYQRSQAVFNEVIGQATDKYAAMAESVDVSAIQQLATSLEDVKDNLSRAIAPVAEFLAGVFAGNMKAAIALLLVFATSVMSKIVPSLGKMNEGLRKTAGGVKASFGSSWGAMKATGSDVKTAYQTATSSPKQLAKRATVAAQDLGPTKSATVTALQNGEKLNKKQLAQTRKMLKRAEKEWKKSGKITTGYMAKEDGKKVRNLRRSIDQMNRGTRNWRRVLQTSAKAGMMGVVHAVKAGATVVTGTFKVMGLAAKGFAWTANMAMKAAGFIGMAMMIWQVFQELMKNIDKIYKWIGGALKTLANSFQWLADKMGKIPLVGKIYSKILGGMADGLDTVADKFTAMGEAETDLLTKERATEALEEKIKAVGEAAAETTAELKAMIQKKNELGGYKNEAERIKITGKMAQTGGGAAVTRLKDLSVLGGTPAQNKVAGQAIADQLEQLEEADPRYKKVADRLRQLSKDGKLTTKIMDQFAKGLGYLNTETATGTNAMDALGEGSKALTKNLADLNKGMGRTVYDAYIKSLGAGNVEFRALAKNNELLLKDSPEMLAYLESVFGKEAADKIKDKAEALKMLNEVEKTWNDLQDRAHQRKLDAIQGKMDKADASVWGGAFGADLQHKQKLLDINREIQEQQDLASLTEQQWEAANPGRKKEEFARDKEIAEKNIAYSKKKLEIEKQNYSIVGQMQKSLSSGVEKMFVDLATGAATLKEALGKLFQSILMDLAKILAKQAAVKAMSAIFLAEGGIIPKAMATGGVIPAYTRGGVATEPTYLVGEGKKNEAVVPLPDNRSIPVDLKGGGSNISNVTVNVSASGGQQTTTTKAGERERKLGQMIAAAVQGEILTQQAPGGILSPYGDGGG